MNVKEIKIKESKIAAVVEASCQHADYIIVMQTETMLDGNYSGMREIAYTWVTKSQASKIAKTFGCVKISDLCGKSAKLKLSYGNQIFPDVVGIMHSDNTLDIKSQPFPRWIKEWKSGKFVTNSMFF